MLAFGWKSLRQNQREIEEAHRPVVIPIVYARPSEIAQSGAQPALQYPHLPTDGVLAVPIKNIGSGPALNVEASVRRLNADGSPSEGGATQAPGRIAGLGKDVVIPIEIDAPDWREVWDFALTLHYEDVGGKRWETFCPRYIAARQRYEDVKAGLLRKMPLRSRMGLLRQRFLDSTDGGQPRDG